MTTLQQLAAGLDAIDDYVRSRLRQAVAELRTRQDQIDESLDRPGDLSVEDRQTRPTGPRRDVEEFAPLNDEETEEHYAAMDVGVAAPTARSSPSRAEDDEGPPNTWLVP